MHQQIRTTPARSPANLAELLAVLADAGINIEAAGGGDVEQGGEFALAVAHGQEEAALAVLRGERYKPRLVDVHHCLLANKPGELLRCITEAATANVSRGYSIKDIAVGVPDRKGRIQVQVYSEARGAASST